MATERHCTDCGTRLSANESHPVCPRCIFRRLADIGSTVPPEETKSPATLTTLLGAKFRSETQKNTDFYAEYELLEEIGRGGMGTIYKALQPKLNRVVALKVIHAAGHASEDSHRRFRSEVKIAGQLNHPNIVPVFDVGVMDGFPSFSMEYFPGGTLADRIRKSSVPTREAVILLSKVARAVFFAHQHGVLHRDIKPANILLDRDGEPHLGDFGLAKELDSDTDLTRSGAVLGSPNYMSPEQASGDPSTLSVATDVYSLGAILYEILTGHPPFRASTPLETMRLVVEQEAPRPSASGAQVDRDLETICLKCLDKEPSRRYATARDMGDDLDRWLRHEPISARRASSLERTIKWARRYPALAILSVLLFVVLVSGLGAVTWQWRTAEEARRRELQERRRAEAALARSSVSLAEAALREGNGSAVQAALATVPKEFQDANWTYLLDESDTSRPVTVSGLASPHDLAANPANASEFAAAADSESVILFNVRTGTRLLAIVPGFATSATNATLTLAFSPDGRRLAIGRSMIGGIVVHDTQTGKKLAEWSTPATGQLQFSSDGASLLQTSANRSTTHLWDSVSGEQRWSLGQGYHSSRFGSNPRHVVSYSWNQQLQLRSADDSSAILTYTDKYFEKFVAQPEGLLLVAANPLGFVRGFDQSDGRQRFEIQPHESLISHLAFFPDGERFLTAATLADGRQSLQCWNSRNGRLCQNLTGGRGIIRALALHPVSGELIVAGSELRVWDVGALNPVRIIRSRNAHPSAVFWGDVLLAPVLDGIHSVQLQTPSGDTAGFPWNPPDDSFGQPSVSADGRRLAIGRYNSAGLFRVLERDAGTIKELASINSRRVISHLRINPHGDRVAVLQSDFSAMGILEIPSGKTGLHLEKTGIKRFSDVAWLEGGARLVGLVTTHAARSTPGSAEEIVLWDASTGKRLHAVTNLSVSSFACASPDGKTFMEAGADQYLRIRDGKTLAIIRQFRAHNGAITALAWHPTRPVVASASEDLGIRLWNLDDGTRLEELRGPLSAPSVLSFSSDGRQLATAARDGVARIWEPRCLASP